MLLDQQAELGHAIIEANTTRASEAAGEHIDFIERSFQLGLEQQKHEVLTEKRRMLAS